MAFFGNGLKSVIGLHSYPDTYRVKKLELAEHSFPRMRRWLLHKMYECSECSFCYLECKCLSTHCP